MALAACFCAVALTVAPADQAIADGAEVPNEAVTPVVLVQDAAAVALPDEEIALTAESAPASDALPVATPSVVERAAAPTAALSAAEQAAAVPTSDHAGWLQTDDGAWYYFHAAGEAPATGWLYLNRVWYYLNPAENGKMVTGAFGVDGTGYVFDPSGAMCSKGWVYSGDRWYYANRSGALSTGWLRDKGMWYWLDPSTCAMATGWLNDNGTWYFLYGSGAMAKGWINLGGTWYYLHNSGAMRIGWLKDRGHWYYLDPSGAMATGWLNDNGTWYFTHASGAMATGWINLGGTWYYLHPSGAMATGWVRNRGVWYWLDPESGAMATGTRTIDGISYYFNDSGAYVSSSEGKDAALERAMLELSWCTNDSMTNDQKLWAAFQHIRNDFPERNPRVPHVHSEGWETLYANDIFIGRSGNCFSCAAAMAFMAKAIGYNDVYVCNNGTHGWAEIDGLIYDPEQARWHAGTYFARPYSMGGGKNYAGSIAAGYSWMRVPL